LRRNNVMARLFRALSGETQKDFARKTGVHFTLIADYELDKVEPSPENLEKLAEGVGLAVEDGEALLRRLEEIQGRRRHRPGLEIEDLTRRIEAHLREAYERLLSLPRPEEPPRPEDRQRAAEQWGRLEGLTPHLRPAVVEVGKELQNWALAERLCEESLRNAGEAAALARLAREVADRVRGPEEWRNRVRGYAAAHEAHALKAAGDPENAEAVFREARTLWDSGSDPAELLDPARMAALEASLATPQGETEGSP
jgi:transcriptional regulator with XRE-family HTH domain